MENRTAEQRQQRASVPAFGGWDGGAPPDYSLDFSKIRAARLQRRKALSWSSFVAGGEQQQRSPTAGGGGSEDRERRRHRRHHSDAAEARQPLRPGCAAPKQGRGKLTGYFFGCMGRW